MVSIITSLYRGEKYLPGYLEAAFSLSKALKEKGISFEFVLICNDETDEERNILENLKDSHFHLIKVPRESLYASWNRGVRGSKFSVCTFWNVDDTRFPEAIVDGLRRIEEGSDLVYFPFIYKRYVRIFGMNFLVKQTAIKPSQFDRNEFARSMHIGPFFMFTKSLYEKAGPFDESFSIAGDFDWNIRAAKTGNFSLSKKIAGIFRNEGTSLSGSKNNRHKEENDRIYEKYGNLDKMELSGISKNP